MFILDFFFFFQFWACCFFFAKQIIFALFFFCVKCWPTFWRSYLLANFCSTRVKGFEVKHSFRLSRGLHHFIPIKCKERPLSRCWGWKKKKKKWDSENNMSADSSSTRLYIYFLKSPELWNHPQVQASWGAVETLRDGCDSKQGSSAVDVQHNVSDRVSFRQTV